MKLAALALSTLAFSISTTGCNESEKRHSSSSSIALVGEWRLCSAEYDLMLPESYVQILDFTESTYTLTRTVYEGQDCGAKSPKLETWVMSSTYEKNSDGKFTSSFTSAKLAIHAQELIDQANESVTWEYSDWQLGEYKDLMNRKDSEDSPVSFNTNKYTGTYRIEGDHLFLNPGRESDGLGEVVPLTRLPKPASM